MGLEKWKQSKLNGRRKYLRKDTSIYAFFKNNGLSFREYVKNVSAGGLFIETSIPISVNNELFMQFFHPDSKKLIKVNGEIIRIDSNGIGVKFDKPQPHIV
ncbi:MAG: PilZ domain-containing protein [Deltaproteobacteria bacterium]|nr:PilZ domain-containing protein [Deltaproteobacteria bacterium]